MSITAMRQALEALEAHADIGIKSDKAITTLRTAIAEAEKQEPVAWMDASETALSWENYLDGMKPLYTTPPAAQRQRVVFPTMLRKMWSGGEVQAWLDENVNKEKNT
jgi:hypothetical protein